jgi:cobalt-zinc-cadmium efflux system outer membrane protein
VVQQQGLLLQLTRYPNPSAGWLQSTSARRSEGDTAGAFISQDIVTAGKLRVAGQAELVEIQWRSLQVIAQIGRVLNDVRIRYYDVLGAQQAMGTAAELERLAADDLGTVRQLLAAKQASRPDELQAEIHLSAVRSSMQRAQVRHQAAWRQLANVVGVPQLPPAPLPDDIEADIPQFDWGESLRRLLAESPVLAAQAAQVREAELEVELQKRLVVPNINVQTVIQRDYARNFNSVSTLVSAPIPLFNRNRGNIINAQGLLCQQQQEYQRLRLALADQLAASFEQYQSARNQVEHLREILPRTRENIELTTQGFKQGQAGFDFMRVRDAQDLYHQTRTSYIEALTSLRKVAIEISGLQLVGGLNPTEIGTALQATPGVPSGLGGVLLQFQQQQQTGVGGTLPGAIQSTVAGP